MRHPSQRASSLWGLLRWKKTAYCSLDNPKTCIVSLPSSAHATPRLTRAAIRAYVYVKNSAVICVCDIDRVPNFKQMNELVALMCFFRKNTRVCGFVGGNDKKLNQNSRNSSTSLRPSSAAPGKDRGGAAGTKEYPIRYCGVPLLSWVFNDLYASTEVWFEQEGWRALRHRE